jgi:hypothetical protein
VHWKPHIYDAPSNATSCLVIALGFGIGSTINTVLDSSETTSANILFAVAMANIVIILKSISVLAKKRAKVPAKYSGRITMFILSTPTFFLYAINRAGVDLFKKLCIALCILQYIYISALAVAINGSYPDWSVAECIRTRKVYITLSGIVGFLSIGVMVYAGFMLKVDLRCNWKWNLGQVSPTTVLF